MKKLLSIISVNFLIAISTVPLNAQHWNIETVDTSGGNSCAITVGAIGYPYISYKGNQQSSLRYTHWDGSLWQMALVETTESVYGVTSITVDVAGNPHIAFDKGLWYGEQLWHAWWDGSIWQQEGVDSLPYSGNVGQWNSIACDKDAFPHFAYTAYTNPGDCYL